MQADDETLHGTSSAYMHSSSSDLRDEGLSYANSDLLRMKHPQSSRGRRSLASHHTSSARRPGN